MTMMLRTWHAVLAPLGKPSIDYRILSADPTCGWSLKTRRVPLLAPRSKPNEDGGFHHMMIGVVTYVGVAHGYLVALGVISTDANGSKWRPTERVIAGELRPEFDIDPADVSARVTVDEVGEEYPLLTFHGGKVTAVVAGEKPAWGEARFTVSDHNLEAPL